MVKKTIRSGLSVEAEGRGIHCKLRDDVVRHLDTHVLTVGDIRKPQAGAEVVCNGIRESRGRADARFGHQLRTKTLKLGPFVGEMIRSDEFSRGNVVKPH